MFKISFARARARARVCVCTIISFQIQRHAYVWLLHIITFSLLTRN